MRKSPTQARAGHTVDAILEAAQILQSDGEEKLNTNRIAERASFSIGTLYQYFGDKDAIVAALAERERDKALATVAKALSSVEPADAQNVIREIVRTMIGSFSKRRRAPRMVMITMLKRRVGPLRSGRHRLSSALHRVFRLGLRTAAGDGDRLEEIATAQGL